MCTEAKAIEITKKLAEQYRRVYGENVVDILLYGSFARADFDGESDIDVAAIVKGNRRDLQEKLKIIWDISAELGLENDVVISPTVIPYAEFEEYKGVLPYYRNISEEGKRIG